MSDTIVAASTYRMKLTARKDGVIWDLTAATITLILRSPSGTVSTKSASILVAADGTAYYDLTISDVTTEGRWRRAWRVVQGSLDLRSEPRQFLVVESLPA
jgi:hypothetical protein